MYISLCKSKIHRAVITQAELNYIGSLTVDANLMEAAGLRPYEKISVVNVNNGARLETYLIKGEPDSGVVCLNGAAARLGQPGDVIIIISYGHFKHEEVPENFEPTVVYVDASNRIASVTRGSQEEAMSL